MGFFDKLANKDEQAKAKNYAEKVQIKAMQKEREEKERKEREEKENQRRQDKMDKLKRHAEEAELKRRINPPKPKAPKARRAPISLGIGKDIQSIAKGIASEKHGSSSSKPEVTPEQQRREFIRNSEAAVAYRIEDNGDTAYKVLVVNNNAVRPIILKEYPPDGVTVKDNAQEAYASVNRYTNGGTPKVSNSTPRISRPMPRISPRSPRISRPMPKLR